MKIWFRDANNKHPPLEYSTIRESILIISEFTSEFTKCAENSKDLQNRQLFFCGNYWETGKYYQDAVFRPREMGFGNDLNDLNDFMLDFSARHPYNCD